MSNVSSACAFPYNRVDLLYLVSNNWCAPLSHPSSCMLVNHGPSQHSSKEEQKPWKCDATARYYTAHTRYYTPHTMLSTRKSVPRASRQWATLLKSSLVPPRGGADCNRGFATTSWLCKLWTTRSKHTLRPTFRSRMDVVVLSNASADLVTNFTVTKLVVNNGLLTR